MGIHEMRGCCSWSRRQFLPGSESLNVCHLGPSASSALAEFGGDTSSGPRCVPLVRAHAADAGHLGASWSSDGFVESSGYEGWCHEAGSSMTSASATCHSKIFGEKLVRSRKSTSVFGGRATDSSVRPCPSKHSWSRISGCIPRWTSFGSTYSPRGENLSLHILLLARTRRLAQFFRFARASLGGADAMRVVGKLTEL